MNMQFRVEGKGTLPSSTSIHDVIKGVDSSMMEYTKKMAKDSHDYAPVLEYILAPGILNSPTRMGLMHFAYGTELSYGVRWEYDHKTKSGYFRRSVEKNAPLLAEELAKQISGGVTKGAKKI